MAIVKMKRVRLFGMRSDREELLKLLQHMGCVEIDEPSELTDPAWRKLSRPDERALNEARDDGAAAQSALAVLKKYAPVKGGLLTPRPEITEKELFDDAAYAASLETARTLIGAEQKIASIHAEMSKKRSQKMTLAPWLGMDLPLETPSTRDMVLSLGTISAKTPLEELTSALAAVTDLAQVTEISADQNSRYLLFVCHRSMEERTAVTLRDNGFTPTSLRGWTGTAKENDQRLDRELAELDRELEETKASIVARKDRRGALERCADRAEQDLKREEAKSRLLDTASTFFLEGWMPAESVAGLSRALEPFACAWETQDPVKEEYEKVPVKLKSNLITEPLTTITEMYSLPAYDGVDPNPLMMPFYVFFFGFMFADLAYGLILAGACALIQIRTKPKGGFGQLVRLMIMCGLSSATIGFLTGGFFSDAISRVCGILGTATPQIPFLTVHPVLDVMNDPMTALILSLIIGMIQILTGMAVKFYMLCRDGQFWDAVWDVGTWWVIFAGIGLAAAGIGSVGGVPVVLVIGLLMLLGQGRNGKGFGRVTAIVGAIYNGATGYFGDVLSYSRLMVMMLAGSVIGQVFNILGAMPGQGLPKPAALIIFFIVFAIGHAFNMALNVIGTYVHTSRLQYLEFFKQFYKEGGRPFRPLDIDTKYVDIIKEEK
ncbi:V-type ATP synthase subunit I [Pseudoflavonifractor sp. MSJ-37]|uniref:V-type ATP synthase subunit I n=1 Tax=Pseudoflavonifractor sp. MSJ-37 TaxID=2841531 RepID=UPI00209D9CFA|nr:V-type ATP synthase subunit I [Pseudoflavonifractor sp. MSJ-37]